MTGSGLLRRCGAALAALAVVCVSLVAAANAAVEPRDRVYASYLPTVDQAARILTFLDDGHRHVGRYRGVGGHFSCWDWTEAFRAADGRWSFYSLAGGGSPYAKGYEDPATFVFKFHTEAQALAAFEKQQRFVRTCMGQQSEDGTTAHLWRQPVPSLGDGSAAYRTVQRIETTTGHRKTRELHIASLRGRYLVNVFNQAEDFQPATDAGVRLVRVSLGNIG